MHAAQIPGDESLPWIVAIAVVTFDMKEEEAIESTWLRLGYDVADDSLLSGLSNCGLAPREEARRMRETWAPVVNRYHLFDDRATADRRQLLLPVGDN